MKSLKRFNTVFDLEVALELSKMVTLIYQHKKIDIKEKLVQVFGFEEVLFFSENSHDDGIADIQFFIARKMIADENITVFCFKGSKEKDDWFANFDTKIAKINGTSIEAHKGFVDNINLFIKVLQDSKEDFNSKPVSELLSNPNTSSKCIFTGHSLGGALATLSASYCSRLGFEDKNILVYTFGAPPIGKASYINEFDKTFSVFRMVNQFDPVPKVNELAKKASNIVLPGSLKAWKEFQHIGEEHLLLSDEQEHHSGKHYTSNIQKEKSKSLQRNKGLNILKKIRKHKWVAISLLLVLMTIVFGLIGFNQTGQNFLDALYNTLSLFAFNFNTTADITWQLEVARFSSVLFVFIAIIKTVVYILDDKLFQPYRLSNKKDHVIVFGKNKFSNILIEDLVKKNGAKQVVMVHNDEDNNHYDYETIRKADYTKKFFKILSLDKASKIVCMNMDDAQDLEIAQALVEYFETNTLTNTPVVYVHLADRALSELFDHDNAFAFSKAFPCEIKVFNTYDNTSRVLFNEYPMEEYKDKSKPSHWLLDGDSAMVESLSLYIGQMAHYEDTFKPKVTFLVESISEKENFFRKYPEFTEACDIEFIDKTSSWKNLFIQGHSITHVAVCYEDQLEGLQRAIQIHQADYELPLFLLQREKEWVSHDNITSFGAVKKMCTSEIIIDQTLDTKAKNIHNYYLNLYGGVTWDELSVFKKNSNRAQAEHIAIKLRGLEWNRIKGFKLFDEFIEANPSLLNKWTEIEHTRWNAFHYVNGWKYSAKRDDSKKLHNCLVSFESLSKEEQDKDTVAITNIPEYEKTT